MCAAAMPSIYCAIWKRGTLRAGEYRFDHPAPVTEVYSRIARGDVFTRSVTIPEGSSIFDIAARLEQAGFVSQQDFLDAAVNQVGLVADLDPGAASLEGYLFPDTYHFPRKFTAVQICAAMVRRFRGGSRANWIEGKRASSGDIGFIDRARDGGGCGAAPGGQRL